jgi:CHAT domain-containing protein
MSAPNQAPITLPTSSSNGQKILTHPYFWSGYTVVGNWN